MTICDVMVQWSIDKKVQRGWRNMINVIHCNFFNGYHDYNALYKHNCAEFDKGLFLIEGIFT